MNPAKLAALLCLLLLAIRPLPAAAAGVPPMVFRHLTVEEGLSQNTVYASMQDADGFLWIATQNGLDRYDGFTVRHFTHERGAVNGLPTSYVYAIGQDRRGDLWLAVKDGGIVQFDPRSETFTNFRHDAGNPRSLASDAVRQLLVDREDKIWIATAGGGLSVLDPVTHDAQRLAHDAARPDSLNSDTVGSIAQDHRGRIWVGTDAGLDLWVPGTQTFKHFTHDPNNPRSLSSNTVATVYVDRNDVIWVGTYTGGLNRFDGEASGFTVFGADAADPERLNDAEVRAVLEDGDGRLWVGTAGGLHLLDRKTGLFTRFVHDKTDPESLRDNYIVSLYQDRGGLLWVGTVDGGVSRWNPRSWLFGHVRPTWNANAYANAFADDGTGALWVGTQGAGLIRYDPQSGQTEAAEVLFHRPHLLPDNRVMALLHSSTGDLWVGTMGAGLVRIAPDGRTALFPGEPRGPGDARALGASGIMSLCEAHDGRIWVGTFRGGLAIIDPRTEQVQRIATDPTHGLGINPPATAIVQDADGSMWVGTDGGGLLALHPDGSLISVWRHHEDDLQSLASDTVYALHVDATGRIWVGSDSAGLDQLLGSARAPAAVRFRNHAGAWNSSDDTIYGIRSDAQGGLWLSGNKGLVRYNPDTGEVRHFHHNQGLQGEEFNLGAHFRLADGRLVFGGSNGFNLFDPRAVTSVRATPPALALTGVELRGQPARLDVPFPVLPNLTIGYRDDLATFEFAALDFAAPELNRYEYRLRGFNDRWLPVRSGHRATFTNLDAGEYEFEVRGATPDGDWSPQTLRLPITMKPAPWRSPPAYAGYVAIGLLLLWSYLAAQRRKLRQAAQQAADLERQVDARTEELRASNVELQRLTRAKSDFLARMSHEIRTPMNGIVGMGEMLMRTNLTDHQVRLATTVHRSATSLMQILNDILDLSKVEAGRLDIVCEPFDLTTVMMETAELFAAQAQDKQLEMIVAPAPDLHGRMLGDPMRIRQILMNLVGNAVKFTAAGGISIIADVIQADVAQAGATPGSDGRRQLSLAVRDSGIGMPPEVAAKVFEPFTQGDESTTRQFGGTGLGLTICRELAELMGGSIHASSRPNEGSTFTVLLPLSVEAGSAPPARAGGREALIIARHPGLADAVMRQFTLLGVSGRWLDPDRDGLTSVVTHDSQTLVIDVESCRAELEWLLVECADRRFAARCIFVGTAAALAGLDTARRAPGARITPKPLGPQVLQRLLLSAQEVPAPAAAPREAGITRLQGRVLIVEDNPVNTVVFEGLLAEIGCTSRSAATGREALAMAHAQSFDAILMDIHMPDMDGWATTRLIRGSEGAGRRTPIIALTADAADSSRLNCQQAGMDDFLTKPLALSDLQRVLARWLPKAAAAAPTAAVLSSKTVSRMGEIDRGGQGGFLKRITGLFIDGSERQVDAILEALAVADFAQVQAQCHSLKSAASHVGADDLALLLIDIERAAKAQDSSRAVMLSGGLRAARDAAVHALQAELERRSA